MRGKEGDAPVAADAVGINPACAGKSRGHRGRRSSSRDHPRVCGEKRSCSRISWRTLGSPPRVRGKVLPLPPRAHFPRITPACAGKSGSSAAGRSAPRDHPRVCGEKGGILLVENTYEGSPPRVRGKAWVAQNADGFWRITPACAGKSCQLKHRFALLRDHPRVCGEKPKSFAAVAEWEGSPPRVRGKGKRARIFCVVMGITPACAGKRLERTPQDSAF